MEPRKPDRRQAAHAPDVESLRRSEARLRLLIASVTDYAIFVLEPDGTVASWNPGAERFKGYKAEEIIGKHFSTFYPKADVEAGKPARELRVAAAEGRVEDEGWRVRKDGSLFWANVVITALRDESGTLIGFAKVTRDLTERRMAEESVRRSEERLRLLIDSVKDYAIFMLDPKGHIASWNPGAQRLKQYTAEEIVGRHFSIFYPQEDLDNGKPARELKVAAATGRFEDEGWRLRKDGSRFWANVVISVVRNGAGELVGFSKVTRDLTERREREEKLRAVLAELRKTNVELEEYAAFVSHDLQEPLRKMGSYSELLARRYKDKLDDEGRHFIAYIVDGATRMRTLITDVLDYARLGSRAQAPHADVPLADVLSRVMADLELSLRESGAKLSVGPLPVVRGDAMLLGRVFQNLLSNAIKYRQTSRPLEIRISAERLGGRCAVTVEDNGIGFEQSHAEEIVRPFKRLHSKESYPGSGLGLATVKKIVELHHGQLTAQGQPGRGSRFSVTLPVSPND